MTPHLTAVALARAEAGLTQQELADRVDASIRTIKRLEQGGTRPRLPLAVRLCRELGITLDDLLDGDGLPGPQEAPGATQGGTVTKESA